MGSARVYCVHTCCFPGQITLRFLHAASLLLYLQYLELVTLDWMRDLTLQQFKLEVRGLLELQDSLNISSCLSCFERT